jgi:WD40 repeat protein
MAALLRLPRDSEIGFVTFGSTYATLDLRTLEWDTTGIGPTGGVNGAAFHEGKLYTVGDAGLVQCGGSTVAAVGSLCNFIVSFGSGLVCGGQMGKVFNALTGEAYHQHHSPLNCAVRISDEGTPGLLIGAYTGEALLFHLRDGVPIFVRTIALHDNAVKGLAASGSELFSVCATGAAAVHRIGSWEKLLNDRSTHGKIANGCAALRGERFASVSRDLRLRIWGRHGVSSFDTPHPNSIKCCAASDDGSLIATGDYAGHVGIFDVQRSKFVDFRRLTSSGISSLLPVVGGHDFIATSYDGSAYRVSGPVQRTLMVA